LKFLIDAQLPPALAPWIVERGHEALHVFDLGLHVADDLVIWERAKIENAIIISENPPLRYLHWPDGCPG